MIWKIRNNIYKLICVDQQQAELLLNHDNCDIVRFTVFQQFSAPANNLLFRDSEAVWSKRKQKKANSATWSRANRTNRYSQSSVECAEGLIEETKGNNEIIKNK